jgi:hypothetical protein
MKILLKMVLFIALCFAYACKHDSKGIGNMLGGEDCAYSVKYDAEVTSSTTLANMADANRLTPQDRVDLMPQTSRNAVEFCMKKDGTSDWLIEKKQPQQVFEAKSYTLPDPSLKSKIIRITNDNVSFLDEKGNLIREAKFEANQLSLGLKDMIKIAKNTNPTGDFEKMLTDARTDGATVTDLGDGVYTLTKKIVKSNEAITVTVTVDKSIGRIVGNAIYDNTGKPKYMVIYSYHGGANPIIVELH